MTNSAQRAGFPLMGFPFTVTAFSNLTPSNFAAVRFIYYSIPLSSCSQVEENVLKKNYRIASRMQRLGMTDCGPDCLFPLHFLCDFYSCPNKHIFNSWIFFLHSDAVIGNLHLLNFCLSHWF